MSYSTHTFGPTCHLGRVVTFSGSKGDDDMPDLKAQFFYSSPLDIDDPLSAVPAPSGSESKPAKHPPRPFSACDTNALEEAWLGLASEKDRKHHHRGKVSKPLTKAQAERRASIVSTLATKHNKKHALEEGAKAPKTPTMYTPTNSPLDPSTSLPAAASVTTAEKHSKRHARAEGAKGGKVTSLLTSSTTSTSAPEGSGATASSKKITCKCKGSHEWCRNSPGKCGCSSCPKASSAAKASSESKLEGDSGAASSNTAKKLEADCDTRQKEEARGNPYNPHCKYPHHVPLDSTALICCSELEKDVRTEHRAGFTGILKRPEGKAVQEQLMRDVMTEAKERKAEKRHGIVTEVRNISESHEFRYTQGDAADEKDLKKASRYSKNHSSSYTLRMENVVQGHNSMECKAYEKHEYSKGHKDFEKHQRPNHNAHSSESQAADYATMDKHKSSGKHQMLSPSAQASETHAANATTGNAAIQGGEAGTTGFPFLRAPSRGGSPQPQSPSPPAHETENQGSVDGHSGNYPGGSHRGHDRDPSESLHVFGCKAHKSTKEHADVPVGISRLHLVKLPDLQMNPIYWSPVHDIACVTRGTWFYNDTMYPVEPAVANQLEIIYRELQPWSQTWNDELNSAIEVGAAGEEKIAHRLWPKEDQKVDGLHSIAESILSTDPYCAARCFHGEAAAVGTVDPSRPGEKTLDTQTIVKHYPNSHVIYKDSRNAFILRPSLQPSAYYGRKPLAKIKKGTTVGIHVVRGFDWKTWDKLHPSKKTIVTVKPEENAPITDNVDDGKIVTCAACRLPENRPKVTDLVLVIHGIGQKLSERLESFHFTHAINALRRSVNVELGDEKVQNVLRKDFGGVMVLPINWRSNLSFEEGGPMKAGDKDNDLAPPDFSLKDITPDTIPAVRNLISDVMLDIPFYMSHHRPKMIQALISEANRVYRLWCKNNPEFHKEGRVHIIAHSLGSAMALEVLSKQPTSVPCIDLHSKKVNTKHCDFNTKNLFFLGSPAGIFLMLENGMLIPRKGRNKPDAEHDGDIGKGITADAGTFGCLAVDNIYNIMHYNDPIAYRLNATVDSLYAASLKNAQVPSATTGFFESIGNVARSMIPGVSSPADLAVGQVAKPAGVARLPSQLEMEVHDFTREEIAEKKFYLLNDNGQVDWFLSSGGGPLEIQYLNMLGAHSCYWKRQDFVRMMVTEVGRKPGKSNVLPNLKAVKTGHKE
jgi:hypothetical protein